MIVFLKVTQTSPSNPRKKEQSAGHLSTRPHSHAYCSARARVRAFLPISSSQAGQLS